tara:strand:- start:309 stop:410 length:102 start_codon:yes stop_codon:yes gene_type:complete
MGTDPDKDIDINTETIDKWRQVWADIDTDHRNR